MQFKSVMSEMKRFFRCARSFERRQLVWTILMIGISCKQFAWAQSDPFSAPPSSSPKDDWDPHDWPQFLGPNSDSKSTETNVVLDWPRSGPPVLWSRELGESYGIGTVVGDHYFQADYADGRARLLCLGRTSGHLVWQYSYDSDYVDLYNYNRGPRTSPVLDQDWEDNQLKRRVYLYGVDGRLVCLDAMQGDVQWQVDTIEKFGVIQNFFGVGSTPIIYNDLLLVMVGGSPAGDQSIPPGQLNRVSGNGTGIVAFDKRTGVVRYTLSDQLASYSSPMVVHRGGRDWCFALMRGGLLAFHPATGNQDFFFPWRARVLESVNASNPVVWDDYVFISETYGPGSALIRFRPSPHQVVWTDKANRRHKAMQTHWNTPIYDNGYLYGSSGRYAGNAELRCIDAMTGKVQWTEPGLGRSSLLMVRDHFVCLSEDGTLRLLRVNPERFDLVQTSVPQRTDGGTTTQLLQYPAWAAPILSHGLLYVRGRDRVVCFDLRPTSQPRR